MNTHAASSRVLTAATEREGARLPTRERTASIRLIWDAVQALRARGCDSEEFLAHHDLSEPMLADSDRRIPQSLLCNLWDDAARESGDPAFGLRLGREPSVRGNPEVMKCLFRHCTTLGEAIVQGGRYERLWQDGRRSSLELAGDRVRWIWRALDGVSFSRTFSEFALSHFSQFSVWAGTDPDRGGLLEVHLPLEPQGDVRAYQAFFGVPVRFGCGYQALIFSASLLHSELAGADTDLKPLLVRLAEDELAKVPGIDSYAERVRQLLGSSASTDDLTLRVIAQRLGVSTRTLKRRLAEEGTTYSAVLDDWRRERGRRYLLESKMSLTEIAFTLGFAEHNVFTRAFQRWYGMSPSVYRKLVLEPSR
ncbi:MAG TPA: AraC family transcriptional regulator [Polyangiaceae bacterium]|nr:AraC family transcriptional regulator [Polyangiaceae bacterium]